MHEKEAGCAVRGGFANFSGWEDGGGEALSGYISSFFRSLYKMGFKPSPAAAAPHLPCWKRRGFEAALAVVYRSMGVPAWPWLARGRGKVPACMATVVALSPDKDPGVCNALQQRGDAPQGLRLGWGGCSRCWRGAVRGEDRDRVLSPPAGDKTPSRLCSIRKGEACGEQGGKEREAGGKAGTGGE